MYECVECGHIWYQDIGLGESEPRQCPQCEYYSVRAYVPSNVAKPLLSDVLAELEAINQSEGQTDYYINKFEVRKILSKYFT